MADQNPAIFVAQTRIANVLHYDALDNTFLSAILQQPLNFGADFVIHSAIKYSNGYFDSVGGCGSQRGKWADKLVW